MSRKMEEKITKVFIDCEEAKHICDKSQYNESTFWERFRLNIRMIYCHITRAYVKRNKRLSKLVKDKKVQCMDKQAKAKLKSDLEKEMNQN